MDAVKSKLLAWRGNPTNISIGKVYEHFQDSGGILFLDDDGVERDALCGTWETIEDTPTTTKSSDGGSTAYYDLPSGATTLNDLIEHKEMSFALGNIFKACYRYGEKDTASKIYDLNKIIYFAERLKAVEEKKQNA